MKLIFNSKKSFYKTPFGAVAEQTAIAFRVVLRGSAEECADFTEAGGCLQLIVRNDGGGEEAVLCSLGGSAETEPRPPVEDAANYCSAETDKAECRCKAVNGAECCRSTAAETEYRRAETNEAMPRLQWEPRNVDEVKNAAAADLEESCEEAGIKAVEDAGKKAGEKAGGEASAGEAGGERDLVYSCSWTAQKPGLYYCRFSASVPDAASGVWPISTEEAQLTVYKEGYSAPDWLSGGLMYQIFPDRFAKSGQYEAPEQKKSYRLHGEWGELPDSGPDEQGIVWNRDFFGGNLKGIEERLPYLQSLGVTVIYLNPIFRAFSNHRYDTANYMEIDPMLGTEEDFSSLCTAAGERGIRIIIDGVFNHTGSHSVYFNKDGAFDTLGAYQRKESPWYRWYSFQDYPEHYDSWWGIDTLPAVNETEESYRDYILRGEDSVVKHWLRKGASGIRLDVADELPDVFLDEVRTAVKGTKPDAAVIGEVWEDASNKEAYGQRRRYFQGDQLDSVMNYPLKDGIIRFINGDGDGAKLRELLCSIMEHYPRTSFHSLMNILGTHDTERILTIFLNGSDSYEQARQKLFLSLLVWAFLPGIPCIYYGDELGMEGGRDPFNRCCFQPEKAKNDIAAFYRRLLLFRGRIDGLGQMELEPGPAEQGVFSFLRKGSGGTLFVLLNLSGESIAAEPPQDSGYQPLDFVNCGSVYTELRGVDIARLHVAPNSGIALYSIRSK